MSGLVVPSRVIEETRQLLRENSYRAGVEAAVLWRGTPNGHVTAAIYPDQVGGVGRFSVSLDERRRIARALKGSGELIVAQVHTHPEEAFHSWIDDREAIPRTVGAFSLVLPEFGARKSLLEDAALFQLQLDGRWVQISLGQISIQEGS